MVVALTEQHAWPFLFFAGVCDRFNTCAGNELLYLTELRLHVIFGHVIPLWIGRKIHDVWDSKLIKLSQCPGIWGVVSHSKEWCPVLGLACAQCSIESGPVMIGMQGSNGPTKNITVAYCLLRIISQRECISDQILLVLIPLGALSVAEVELWEILRTWENF